MELISRKPARALLKGSSKSGKRLCQELGKYEKVKLFKKVQCNIYVTIIVFIHTTTTKPNTNSEKTFSGAHTIGCETDNNYMISFSNFKADGNVKTFEGQEYIVTEDINTYEKYKDSEACFHSLYNHWSKNGAYIDMREFLKNEKRLIMQEKKKETSKAPESRTSLFLHDMPLQGDYISYPKMHNTWG